MDCGTPYRFINTQFITEYFISQSIFLSKVNKRGDDADSDEYRGLSSNFGVYDTTQHQYKEFNKNGRGRTVCNTTNLNEHENNSLN